MSSPLKDAVRNYIDANGGGDGCFATPIGALTLMRSSSATCLATCSIDPRSASSRRAQSR